MGLECRRHAKKLVLQAEPYKDDKGPRFYGTLLICTHKHIIYSDVCIILKLKKVLSILFEYYFCIISNRKHFRLNLMRLLVFSFQTANQIDLNEQSDLMASFEGMLWNEIWLLVIQRLKFVCCCFLLPLPPYTLRLCECVCVHVCMILWLYMVLVVLVLVKLSTAADYCHCCRSHYYPSSFQVWLTGDFLDTWLVLTTQGEKPPRIFVAMSAITMEMTIIMKI